MRQLGTVADQTSAQRFGDFLLTKGISVSVDPAPGGWAIWVRNEDHLDDARREFHAFTAEPNATVYREAARPAEQLRSEEQRRAAAAKKNLVDVSRRWRRAGVSGSPVTALLLAASVVVAVLSNLGGDQAFDSRLTIDLYVATPQGILPALLWLREPWRLVTPIFLHFGMMHILFNMIMLWQLGIPVERAIGSLRYALLVLAIAIPSNFSEYLWDLHLLNEGIRQFGGMSGVLVRPLRLHLDEEPVRPHERVYDLVAIRRDHDRLVFPVHDGSVGQHCERGARGRLGGRHRDRIVLELHPPAALGAASLRRGRG